MNDYKYRGARAMVLMHEQNMKTFYSTWLEAKEKNIILPKTDDPDYASLESLLIHILRSSGGYISWICKNLKLNMLEIKTVPDQKNILAEAENYINHLCEIWNTPLIEVPFKEFKKVFVSNWGWEYSIDSMMEHAVMHPLRHEFQLKEILNG